MKQSQRSHPSFLSMVGGQMLPQPWQTPSLLYSAFQSSRTSCPLSALFSFIFFPCVWFAVCVWASVYLYLCLYSASIPPAFMNSQLQLTPYCLRRLFTSISGRIPAFVPCHCELLWWVKISKKKKGCSEKQPVHALWTGTEMSYFDLFFS